MKSIEISEQSFLRTDDGSRFIPLGEGVRDQEEQELLRRKIKGETRMRQPGVWGTLGKAENDTQVTWSGRLTYSGYGNDTSKGITLEEIQDIYDANPVLRPGSEKVIERFINFDEVTFNELGDSFDADSLPRLRLTLFLKPDEGAMVYYHHFTGKWIDERNSDMEYILPEPTPENTTSRDRLDYKFTLLPNRKIKKLENGRAELGDPVESSFVVKILVFRRPENQTDSYQLVQKGIEHVRTKRRYQLLKYNPENNEFTEIENAASQLASDAKTLFLLHGTFSSTEGSFGGLRGNKHRADSWLKEQSQKYAQIIGFDHSTIMHHAEDNLGHFREMMGGVHFQNQPMDMITFSRGGLLGKSLACGVSNDHFPLRRAALVSCANGVGYFTAARYLGVFLRYLKKSTGIASGGMGAIISLFAQHSGKFFLSRPGPQMMTIGTDDGWLEQLLEAKPAPQNNEMQFKAITGKWTREVAAGNRLLNRLAQRGINLLTRPILGNPNDFVVGSNRQALLPPGWETDPVQLKCTHTSFFTGRLSAKRVCDELDGFLG